MEEEGVKGMVGVYEYALHLPYGDVLSMEDEDSFKRIFVVRDTSLSHRWLINNPWCALRSHQTLIYFLICKGKRHVSLFYIVRSLMQLQRTYGTITNIKGAQISTLYNINRVPF